MNLHLGVTFGLLAAAGAAIYLTPPVTESPSSLIVSLLDTAAGWTSTEGVSEEVLPRDPRERLSVRRTYRKGNGVAFVSVALFTRQDDPERRASINFIYPQRGASLIERSYIEVTLDQKLAKVPIPAIIVHRDAERLAVFYWHQIRKDTYGSEYHFRLALLRRTLFVREASSWLIRIAWPLVDQYGDSFALDERSNIARSLYRTLAELDR